MFVMRLVVSLVVCAALLAQSARGLVAVTAPSSRRRSACRRSAQRQSEPIPAPTTTDVAHNTVHVVANVAHNTAHVLSNVAHNTAHNLSFEPLLEEEIVLDVEVVDDVGKCQLRRRRETLARYYLEELHHSEEGSDSPPVVVMAEEVAPAPAHEVAHNASGLGPLRLMAGAAIALAAALRRPILKTIRTLLL